MTHVLPLSEQDLFLRAPIGTILDQLAAGALSPRDIAEVCLARTAELGEKFKVWATFSPDILLAQAVSTGARVGAGHEPRLLEGIPVGVKDIFNTYDLPTQMGSQLWSGFTAGNDARVVHSLKDAGASIPGKTDTAEFAVHAIGNCLNPHDIARTPGTSSSGSAVAVALGIVPAAIGTQTAGSIVRPASFCGTYGCKPSFGLIPRTGMLKTTDSLDTIGYFSAMYEDLERLFDVLRVHGPNYPLSHAALTDETRQTRSNHRPWKVAFVRTHTWGEAAKYAKDAIVAFVASLDSDKEVDVDDVALPPDIASAHDIHQTIYDKTLSYYFQEEFQSSDKVSPIMNAIITRGKRISVQQYHDALRQQESLTHSMDSFFDNYDILVSLSTAGEAPLREETERSDPSLIWTLTHLPVLSAPVFLSPGGLPFGIQLAARKYNDLLLFRFCDYLRSLDLIPKGVNPRSH